MPNQLGPCEEQKRSKLSLSQDTAGWWTYLHIFRRHFQHRVVCDGVCSSGEGAGMWRLPGHRGLYSIHIETLGGAWKHRFPPNLVFMLRLVNEITSVLVTCAHPFADKQRENDMCKSFSLRLSSGPDRLIHLRNECVNLLFG